MEPPPVQYVTTREGVRIAYSVSGSGRPLVVLGPALGGMPLWWRFAPEWMMGLAARFRLIQHDLRGHGMSERGLPPNLAVGDDEKSLEAILDRLQLDRFIIYGLSGVGHEGVRYAAAYPERVEALILNGTTVSVATPSFWAIAAENWEFFLRSFVPASVGPEDSQRWFETLRDSTTLEDWLVRSRVAGKSNILESLGHIRVPTLVLHARGLALTPSEGATRLAAMIPDARLVVIGGDHPLGDAGEGLAAIDQFLGELPSRAAPPPVRIASPSLLSGREKEVLRLLSTGKSNKQIADEITISVRTVERHINHIYEKIGVSNRVEAARYATRAGLISE
jgi:pimeloyl-ACP methyl ester carboxylesterase/DNA-binding CsgD family transcriptional regulator